MRDKVFSNPDVQNALQNYVFYEVKWQRNQYLCYKYGVSLYPSFRIVDAMEQPEIVIRSSVGYKKVADLLDWMKE